MQPPPQIIILAVSPAEKRAEVVELSAAQDRAGAAAAQRVAVLGRDAIDLGRLELGRSFTAQQRQRDRIVERKAQIGQQHPPLQFARHLRQRLGQQRVDHQVGGGQLAAAGDRFQHGARIAVQPARDCGKVPAQCAAGLALEIQGQRLVHGAARRLAGIGLGLIDVVPVFGQAPRQQPQPPDPKAQIVIAKKRHGLGTGAALHRRQLVEPMRGQPAAQPSGHRLTAAAHHQFGRSALDRRAQFVEDLRKLDLAIGKEGVSGLRRGGLLRLAAPCREPFGVGPIEKQCVAEQLGDLRLDLGPQRIDNPFERRQLPRRRRNCLQVVTHRLFARDRGQRSENDREKPRRAPVGVPLAADFIGMRIDIDEPPIDLALGRPVAQHRHRLGERRIDQHRTVDQRDAVGIAAVAVFGQHPLDKRGAAGPGVAALGRQGIDFGQLERGECARKAGGGARGQYQFERRGERLAAGRGGDRAKPDRDAVFALLDHRRAVEPQHFGVPLEIGRGHEQIDRVPGRQQRRLGLARAHRIERLAEQARKAEARERRDEPARADQPRQLAAHFGAGFGCHAGRDDIARPLEHPVYQRHRPELRQPGPRPRLGIEQHFDVCAGQPQVGQRFKALSGMDRLGQEHPVDPACAGPGNDVGQHL